MKSTQNTMTLLTITSILIASSIAATGSLSAKTFTAFVLAGESNMEGQVQSILIEHQAKDLTEATTTTVALPGLDALVRHLRMHQLN